MKKHRPPKTKAAGFRFTRADEILGRKHDLLAAMIAAYADPNDAAAVASARLKFRAILVTPAAAFGIDSDDLFLTELLAVAACDKLRLWHEPAKPAGGRPSGDDLAVAVADYVDDNHAARAAGKLPKLTDTLWLKSHNFDSRFGGRRSLAWKRKLLARGRKIKGQKGESAA